MTDDPSVGVSNQVLPLTDYNLFATDGALREALVREGAAGASTELMQAGATLGRAASFEQARLANRNGPILHTHNAQGERIDTVEFHPAWHALLEGITGRGYHSSAWAPDAPKGAHVARAAGFFLQGQIESGSLCPTTMTFGSIAALRRDCWLNAHWVPRLLSRHHDPRSLPFDQKTGGMIGMGMTEKQGGSDVRANTTHAELQSDGTYRLTGHKWFFSAPQCDAHLVLAQTRAGLSCFFVPRFTPDGSRNTVRIQRLKDKLGNRSNASAEVELSQTWGRLLGEEGKGIRTILEMATYTRLDCVLGTGAMMRQGLVQALHHVEHRHAFGRPLGQQPLMRAVIADLALESEAATVLALRLARAFDHDDDAQEVDFRRVMTSASKFWVCKRGPDFMAEAMEVLGGNGYVEEGVQARMYREMPVNSIWEGSGNVMCLDVLRAFSRTASTREVIAHELSLSRGLHPMFDASLANWLAQSAEAFSQEISARRWTQQLVLLMQGSILLRSSRQAVAESFCASRLGGAASVYGARTGIDTDAVLAANRIE